MASSVEQMIRKTVTKGIMKVADFNRSRLEAPSEPHPYLTGINTPMTEEKTITDLKVSGSIPPQLDGRYIRIGPNPIVAPNPATYHWFTGDGMVHGLRLQAGKALWYRNRWTRSKAVSKALGESPAPGPRNGFSDTVNTNVLGHAGKIWGLVEAGGYPVELDENLKTLSHNPFEGSLKGSFSAHPHKDPETGELHAICYFGPDQTTIRHVVVSREGKVRREEPIAVKHGPSIHDCMITKNYVLIFDLPVVFSMKTLLAGHPFPYAWNPDHRARVGLLPREGKGTDIIWCEVSPAYVFHPCNAYETEDGKVVVDVAAHDSMFAESTQGPDSSTVSLERWTADPKTLKVSRRVLDDHPQEFPRFDERLTGKPYRYAYALPLERAYKNLDPANHYIKNDLKLGTREVHQFGTGRVPGEFVFVPKHDGSAEDEGWLMGYVIDLNTDTTDLVIFDAQNFSGPDVARVTIHGNWVAQS
jgi:8'-apo-carotenoid 13,14-cleaving dioxygenase